MIRLKELRRKKNITQQKIADVLGVSQATYSGWESERVQMDYASLITLAEFFNVSVDYLLGKPPKRSEVLKKGISIPLYGDVGLLKNQYVLEHIGYETLGSRSAIKGVYFGIRAADDSLSPEIRENDIMIIRKQSRCKSGDIAVILFDNEYIAVKQVFLNQYGVILNDMKTKATPELLLRRDIKDRRIRIIGKVVELRRKI